MWHYITSPELYSRGDLPGLCGIQPECLPVWLRLHQPQRAQQRPGQASYSLGRGESRLNSPRFVFYVMWVRIRKDEELPSESDPEFFFRIGIPVRDAKFMSNNHEKIYKKRVTENRGTFYNFFFSILHFIKELTNLRLALIFLWFSKYRHFLVPM
jgi:hypothetical protein